MNSSLTPRSSLHAASARPRNSGPLSRTMALLAHSRFDPARAALATRLRGVHFDGRHSRVQSSTMVNIRITFPVLTQSLTKSIDQRSFGLVAAGLLTTPFQRIRRRCRILIANPSLRYSRYTRL
jgi:hypothetical protein